MFVNILTVLCPLFLSFLLCWPAASYAESPLCRNGLRQSPIDIVSAVKKDLPSLSFAYRPVPLQMRNDGHTVRLRIDDGGELRIGQDTYRFEELHFHSPGGDRLAGEEFPFAAHLLHRSRSGQLLAVVLLFRRGAENPLLASLWPKIPARNEGNKRFSDSRLNVISLLPAHSDYYRYAGSLTASPCTENVTWVVMKKPLELSTAQLMQWKSRFADNIRQAQPLHERVIWEGPAN